MLMMALDYYILDIRYISCVCVLRESDICFGLSLSFSLSLSLVLVSLNLYYFLMLRNQANLTLFTFHLKLESTHTFDVVINIVGLA